jgi:rubrerythrin
MAGSCGRSKPASLELAAREVAERTSRRDILGAAAGAGMLVGIALLGGRTRSAAAAPSQALDQKILNFALLLEYLQAAFYTDAVRRDALRGDVADFAKTVAEHERAHVEFLRGALGSRARKRPRFDFGDATKDQRKFLAAAVLLENTGVAAYNGQAANLTKKTLVAAAEIVSVEGRHAAWISALAGEDPAPRAADPGASARDVVSTLHKTGFLVA